MLAWLPSVPRLAWSHLASALALTLALGGCGSRTPLTLPEDGGPVGDDDDDLIDGGDPFGDDDDDDDVPMRSINLQIAELVQDCMPVIPRDNVIFEGTLLIRNGPDPMPETEIQTIQILRGGLEVASFEPSDETRFLPAVDPLARVDLEVRKAPDSLEPPLSCTLCGGERPDFLRLVLNDRESGAFVADVEIPLDIALRCLG